VKQKVIERVFANLLLVTCAVSLALDLRASPGSSSKPTASPAATTPQATVAPSAPVKTDTKPAIWTREEAKRVLRIAEEIRSVDKGRILVTLTTEANNRTTVYDIRILRSTNRRAHLEFIAPQEERGRRMLAQGNSYWSTFPDSKRVVAISRREAIGNSAFAMADVFQMDSETDYDPEISAREQRNGVNVLKLDLKAKHKEAPYARVIYYVEESGYFPVEAQFYGMSGKLLKTMHAETRKQLAGRQRVERSRMIDNVTQGRVSVWLTREMKEENIPDQVFTREYLKTQ